MAIGINVEGPCLVQVNTGSAGALEDLGYTIDGAQVTEEAFMSDVPGDQNGGSEGPPIDIQYYGQIHRVRLEMSKYDKAVAEKLGARLLGGAAGVIGANTPGSLLAGGSLYHRLLLKSTTTAGGTSARNYVAAICRGAIEVNRGTRWSRLVMEFECHSRDVSGTITLWNTTTA